MQIPLMFVPAGWAGGRQEVLTFFVQFIKWRILSSVVQEKQNEPSRSFYQGVGD